MHHIKRQQSEVRWGEMEWSIVVWIGAKWSWAEWSVLAVLSSVFLRCVERCVLRSLQSSVVLCVTRVGCARLHFLSPVGVSWWACSVCWFFRTARWKVTSRMASCKSSVWRRRKTAPPRSGMLTILMRQYNREAPSCGCQRYEDSTVHRERTPEGNSPNGHCFKRDPRQVRSPSFHFFPVFALLFAFSNVFSFRFLLLCFSVLFSVFLFLFNFFLFFRVPRLFHLLFLCFSVFSCFLFFLFCLCGFVFLYLLVFIISMLFFFCLCVPCFFLLFSSCSILEVNMCLYKCMLFGFVYFPCLCSVCFQVCFSTFWFSSCFFMFFLSLFFCHFLSLFLLNLSPFSSPFSVFPFPPFFFPPFCHVSLFPYSSNDFFNFPPLFFPFSLPFMPEARPQKFLTTKKANDCVVNPGVWWATWDAGCHAQSSFYVGRPCGHGAHVVRSGFFGTWLVEETTRCWIADVVGLALRVYAGGAWALWGVVIHKEVERGRRRRGSFFFFTCGLWHPVMLGWIVAALLNVSRCAFVSRMPCASTG